VRHILQSTLTVRETSIVALNPLGAARDKTGLEWDDAVGEEYEMAIHV